jgi:hypothetical protein
VICNTSADQSLLLYGSKYSGINLGHYARFDHLQQGTVNITTAMDVWVTALAQVMSLFHPFDGTSVLFPVLGAQNLSYLSILYYGITILRAVQANEDNILSSTNTPADGSWTCVVRYIPKTGQDNNFLGIGFLPTGEIDRTQTSNVSEASANTLLGPAISSVRLKAERKGLKLDFWRFINFFFVSNYWFLLLSLGQDHTTLYPSSSVSHGSDLLNYEFSKAKSYDSNYNIFLNATLFEIYSSHLSNTVLPLLDLPSITFEPLSEQNRLELTNRTLLRSYTCQVRQQKEPFTAFFSVITTVYVFTTGPFHLIMFIATFFKTRNNKEGPSPVQSIKAVLIYSEFLFWLHGPSTCPEGK